MPTFPNYTKLSIVNMSTIISDVIALSMVTALNILLVQFCRDWSLATFSAVYVPKGVTAIPPNTYIIYLMDNSDVSGALAYHDLSSDIPYGKVFAKTVIANGGVLLYESTLKKPTVAQALSHEVFELLVDPRCNIWWMNYNTGVLTAGEVGDPVENNVVVVTLTSGTKIGMSDWILPSWQDAQNTKGPFNYLNTLTAPFQIKNGYAIQIRNGRIIEVYGDTPNKIYNGKFSGRYIKKLGALIN